MKSLRIFGRHFFYELTTPSLTGMASPEKEEVIQEATYNTFVSRGGGNVALIAASITVPFLIFIGAPLLARVVLSLHFSPYWFLVFLVAQIIAANVCYGYGKARITAPELTRLIEDRNRHERPN